MDVLQRLALYQYLEAAIVERSVLEIGCGDGVGLYQLLQLGAARVAGADPDPEAARRRLAASIPRVDLYALQPRMSFAEEAYDLVCVTDASLCRDRPGLPAEVARILAPGGRAAFCARSGDHPDQEGLTYGELLDLLESVFTEIRIIGLCPMSAYGLVELREDMDPEELDVALDGTLMGGVVEEVQTYLAWCQQEDSQDERDHFPYGIVQVPTGGVSVVQAHWGLQPAPGEGGDRRGKLEPGPEETTANALRARWQWPTFLRRREGPATTS